MASKKKNTKATTVAKATTKKVPALKNYKQSKDVSTAYGLMQQAQKNKPTYTSKYGEKINSLADRIANRQGFNYDFTKDVLYQNYKDQATRQAQLAMQNTTAQASALTGGYGNSYAATAGNLAFQENMAAVNNIIPTLYEAALNRYNSDIDNQRADMAMYQGLEDTEYGKYRDSVADWQTDRDYTANRYDAAYDKDYTGYQQGLANKQWNYEMENANKQWAYEQNANNSKWKKEQSDANYWNQKDYELSKASLAASKRASSSSKAKTTKEEKKATIPADVKNKVKEWAKVGAEEDKERILTYLYNCEQQGVITSAQSDYIWNVVCGYNENDIPKIK